DMRTFVREHTRQANHAEMNIDSVCNNCAIKLRPAGDIDRGPRIAGPVIDCPAFSEGIDVRWAYVDHLDRKHEIGRPFQKVERGLNRRRLTDATSRGALPKSCRGTTVPVIGHWGRSRLV